MADTEQQIKKYRANCHCGAFIFEFEAPEIKSGVICNCSICYKKGYFAITPGVELTIVKDEGTIKQYQFGEKKWKHQFCSKCGTGTFGTSEFFEPPMNLGINARCIQDLDIWSLEERHVDSAKFPPPYKPSVYAGPLPTPSSIPDGQGKLYHGSCHCGAVTAALKVDHPFDSEEYKGPIIECNCSHCVRVYSPAYSPLLPAPRHSLTRCKTQGGYIWAYPLKDQLAISGAEHLTYYTFNDKIVRKASCKHCGVLVLAEPIPVGENEELSEEVRKFRESFKDIRPFNLRVVNQDELDVEGLRRMPGRVKREEGRGRGNKYINP
ncbi:Mss4-like protein [Apiosordaria backusii]|uniref:Mss4-like protein n=1 Tax=Apiosordaria backusii TaxID=314023 RepID=A0AA40K1C2_9PEZI|nr:Mss4-like protein [Apiosordaria backusii]